MLKTFERIGDRLLTLVVPSTDAAAGCPPDPHVKRCSPYCPAPYKKSRVKNCSFNGACKEICGPCYYVTGNCA